MRSRRSLKDLREVTINPNESAISLTVHPPLYPPGRIMHIVRHHPKKDECVNTLFCKMLTRAEAFQPLWEKLNNLRNSEFFRSRLLSLPG